MEELENETEAEAGAGAETKEQKKMIAKKFGCKIKNVQFISEGGEGNIYSFVDKNNRNRIIKIYSNKISNTRGFRNVREETEKQEELIKNTRKTIKALAHGNFTYKNKEIFYQIYNYMDFDLENAIYNNYLNPYESFMVALRTVIGICSLHKNGIAHRDIKLENIMVNLKDKKTKIIDFGFSEKIEENTKYAIGGTFEYISPELIKSLIEKQFKVYNNFIFPSDIYALGITLFTILTKDATLINSSDYLKIKLLERDSNMKNLYINIIQK